MLLTSELGIPWCLLAKEDVILNGTFLREIGLPVIE